MDPLLVLGASARLTRLVTTDDLGAMWLREPLQRAALQRSDATVRYADGLDCPFCAGFWVSLLVTSSYTLSRRRPATLAAWRIVAAALTANYVTGHVSARLDG